MRVEAFLDTNVLIYAVSSAPAEATKKERALDLIMNTDFGLSAKVLQEFYVNVTRMIATPWRRTQQLHSSNSSGASPRH